MLGLPNVLNKYVGKLPKQAHDWFRGAVPGRPPRDLQYWGPRSIDDRRTFPSKRQATLTERDTGTVRVIDRPRYV
jgi:hypothetical protein